jgi:thiamine-monophosphate kinase
MTDEVPPEASGEDRLIEKYFRPLASDPGAFGLIDDAGVLTPPAGCDVVLKTDPIIAGVHFFPDDPAGAVGRKALRVNLSDLAAKGAQPAGFLLALALPQGVRGEWLAAFAQALGEDAHSFGCPLLGGDTDQTPGPLTVSIAAFGTVPQGTMVRRSGARPGDRILVTGTIGDAALGLRLRRDPRAATTWHIDAAMGAHLADRYLVPRPRNALAEVLRRHASAAMDISDGLAGDLAKLCRASGVSAEIEVERIALSDAVRTAIQADAGLIDSVITGGDDYEILCTVPPTAIDEFHAAAAKTEIAVTEIGRILPASAPLRLLDHGRPLVLEQLSFNHFRTIA